MAKSIIGVLDDVIGATGLYGIFRPLNPYKMLSSLLLILLIGQFLYSWFIKPFRSPIRKIPGLPYNPIVGNMREGLSGQAMEASLKWLRKYGTILRYYFFFGSERVIVADPNILKHILVLNSKNYIKPKNRLKWFKKIAGKQSVLITEGTTHAAQRKLINPAFKSVSIQGMVKTFDKGGRKLSDMLLESVRKESGNSVEVAMDTLLPRLTLDIIGECAFDYQFNSLENPDSEISAAFQTMLGGIALRWWNMIPFYEHLPTSRNKQLDDQLSLIKKTVGCVIEEKRKESVTSGIVKADDEHSVRKNLLSMLMAARDEDGQGMTDQCLQDQVLTFMLAGHETTATSMSWILLALAQNPEIQMRAREEARQVLPPRGQPITWNHLDNLKYLTCVIKEALRMYPPVPLTLREALEEDHLGEYYIPAGTILLLAVGPMMRLPQHFEDPDEFKPERFLEEQNESTENLYRFLPFLMGPRMCIGYKFALAEMKTLLAILLRDLSFMTTKDSQYTRKFRATMKPNPSLVLMIKEVEG